MTDEERAVWLDTPEGIAWTAAKNAPLEPAPEPAPLDEHDSRNPASGYEHPAPVKIRRSLGGN